MSKCSPITRIIPASFAWIILLFATGVFFAFPCRYLMSVYTVAIPVFQSIVTFFVTVNFGLATFVNPGAIPKAASDEIKNVISSSTFQDIEIRGVRVRLKWCVTCQFFRPPRCVHCGICDTCIETFDHHCPWVNNCIGRRNYRYFFMFLLWLTIHMISILSLCALYMKDHLNNMKQLDTVMTLSVIGIIILLFIPIFGLTGFHIMLITQGLTTNEQVTGKFVDVPSPYNKGCLKNIFYSLCNSPLPRYYLSSSSQCKKSPEKPKTPDGNESNHSDKFFAVQYQYVGKNDSSLSKQNDSYDCGQPAASALLNRGALHLSLSGTLHAKYPESSAAFRGGGVKGSRAITPPVPVRFDYSRRSLPPHNKFHATTPGYFRSAQESLCQGHQREGHFSSSKMKSDHSLVYSAALEQQNLAAAGRDFVDDDYGVSAPPRIYPHLHHKSGDGFLLGGYHTNPGGKGLASDTCCLGNQTVDKLQELANRSVIGGQQCADMSVLEVFPKACSSFQAQTTTPPSSKELQDDGQQQQLLISAQTPLYNLSSDCSADCRQQVAVGHHHHHQCQSVDFLRTPGNRPLSFVKAMEMSENLNWSDENGQNFKTADSTLLQFSLAPPQYVDANSTSKDEQKSDHEISYEISV